MKAMKAMKAMMSFILTFILEICTFKRKCEQLIFYAI